MDDLNTSLREAFIAGIQPLISAPVYDWEAKTTAPGLYVLLKDINSGELPTKSSYYNDVSLQVHIIKKFDAPERGNYTEVDVITNNLLRGAIRDKVISMLPVFKIVTIKKESDRVLKYDDKTAKIYTRILTFRMKIMQLT